MVKQQLTPDPGQEADHAHAEHEPHIHVGIRRPHASCPAWPAPTWLDRPAARRSTLPDGPGYGSDKHERIEIDRLEALLGVVVLGACKVLEGPAAHLGALLRVAHPDTVI